MNVGVNVSPGSTVPVGVSVRVAVTVGAVAVRHCTAARVAVGTISLF